MREQAVQAPLGSDQPPSPSSQAETLPCSLASRRKSLPQRQNTNENRAIDMLMSMSSDKWHLANRSCLAAKL